MEDDETVKKQIIIYGRPDFSPVRFPNPLEYPYGQLFVSLETTSVEIRVVKSFYHNLKNILKYGKVRKNDFALVEKIRNLISEYKLEACYNQNKEKLRQIENKLCPLLKNFIKQITKKTKYKCIRFHLSIYDWIDFIANTCGMIDGNPSPEFLADSSPIAIQWKDMLGLFLSDYINHAFYKFNLNPTKIILSNYPRPLRKNPSNPLKEEDKPSETQLLKMFISFLKTNPSEKIKSFLIQLYGPNSSKPKQNLFNKYLGRFYGEDKKVLIKKNKQSRKYFNPYKKS